MNLASELPDDEVVFLPAEDRNRMSRLYEEVWIRLEEMAMIMSRTLKIKASRETEIRFCPFAPDGKFGYEAVELVRSPQGCGWYDYRRGLCFESEGADSEACPMDE